jgi:glycosyltransferase involved in cell wall biosynthesis
MTQRSARPLHEWFGRAAEKALRGPQWQALVCWSGVGEEIFRSQSVDGLRVCHRSSAHIRVQDRLLRDEGIRAGQPIERPSAWLIAREEREYDLSDAILVPSTFVRRSFVQQGIAPEKILMVPLGVDNSMFRPERRVVEERCRRIVSGAPLHVAYVGALSLRKGLKDLLEMSRTLRGQNIVFHATGAVAPDAERLMPELAGFVVIHGSRAQRDLPATYAAADLFVFPTIEDGFGMVVTQALAAAGPVICTANCCGPDVLTESVTGWTVAAQSPQSFVDRLLWCNDNRSRLAEMVWACYERFTPRSWADMASDVVQELARRPKALIGLMPAARAAVS